MRLVVRCSKGTYIRTLVEDIAKDLGTVAHVGALRRLAVLPFADRPMHTLDELERLATDDDAPAALDALLLPPDLAVPEWPAVVLTGDVAARFAHGQEVQAGERCDAGPGARLCGIGRVHRHRQGQRRGFTGPGTRFSALTDWRGIENFGMMRPFHRQAKGRGR